MVKCNHPKHLEYLEEDVRNLRTNPAVYKNEKTGKNEIMIPKIEIFVKSLKYGEICINCVSHELGAFIEEHPIHDNI
jgi:hypothetical protein